jgi:hypothetical protein
MLFADTSGQLVNQTSFQSSGTVVDTRLVASVTVIGVLLRGFVRSFTLEQGTPARQEGHTAPIR